MTIEVIPIGLAVICTFFGWLGSPEVVDFLTNEDGLIESLTALCYLFGFLIGATSISRGKRGRLAIIWTILCMFFLAEETSWFQRIFQYSIPSAEALNYQNEFNLHNLKFFQGNLNPQYLFRFGFVFYFLIVPLLANITRVNKILDTLGYKKPSNKFLVNAFSVLALNICLSVISGTQGKEALAEIREMFYAFIILAYIYFYIWKGAGFYNNQSTKKPIL